MATAKFCLVAMLALLVLGHFVSPASAPLVAFAGVMVTLVAIGSALLRAFDRARCYGD